MEKYIEYIETQTENNRVLIITDVHNCHKEWHDTDNYDRMEIMCDALKKEMELKPYDLILMLGDYSLDFWEWEICGSYLWENKVSRTKEFMERFYPKLPKKAYMIPGNHEQYSNEDWKGITGFEREFAVVYGDYVFAMLDTFAGNLDPKVHSDGEYTGINTAFLEEVLKRHKDKKIILCMHDLIIEKESEEARRLITEEKRIACAFAGHTHKSCTRILPEEWRGLAVFYSGDFSYNGGHIREKNWGYRIVEPGGGIYTDYIRV